MPSNYFDILDAALSMSMSTTASRAIGVGVTASKVMQPPQLKGPNAPKGGPASVSSKSGLPAPSLTEGGARGSVSNVPGGKRGSFYGRLHHNDVISLFLDCHHLEHQSF